MTLHCVAFKYLKMVTKTAFCSVQTVDGIPTFAQCHLLLSATETSGLNISCNVSQWYRLPRLSERSAALSCVAIC